MEDFALHPPRHAFDPRDVARAGDVWRLLQEAAAEGSERRGWSPDRYAAEGSAFVVRAMRVVHHRPFRRGEPLRARTWVSTFRRGVFTDRQIRLYGPDPVASATQAWVHVRTRPDVRVARAPEALESAFPVESLEPDVELPPWRPVEGPSWEMPLQVWYTWMDPMGHANHPAYVDWCDEALSRVLGQRGADPYALAPIAEEVQYRAAVVAPEAIRIRGRLVGVTAAGAAVCAFDVIGDDDRVCATATTIRDLADAPGALPALLAP